MQGHYWNETNTYPYVICCPDFWPEGYAELSFKFSNTTTQQGHVSIPNSTVTNFGGKAYFGTKDCYATEDDCASEEACLFKLSDVDNSHVMDCSQEDFPVENDFKYNFCCKIKELCWDGIDNDGDGDIDCADIDCFGDKDPFNDISDYDYPQNCTNPADARVWSPLVTDFCAVSYDKNTELTTFDPECITKNPYYSGTPYYCAFGTSDDPAVDQPGVCCPHGTRPELIPAKGLVPEHWDCSDSDECGISPSKRCKEAFWETSTDFWDPVNTPNWLSEVYSGDQFDFCNTQIPNLFEPEETLGYKGSNGCCLIPKYGEINYWFDVDNIKVFG